MLIFFYIVYPSVSRYSLASCVRYTKVADDPACNLEQYIRVTSPNHDSPRIFVQSRAIW